MHRRHSKRSAAKNNGFVANLAASFEFQIVNIRIPKPGVIDLKVHVGMGALYRGPDRPVFAHVPTRVAGVTTPVIGVDVIERMRIIASVVNPVATSPTVAASQFKP